MKCKEYKNDLDGFVMGTLDPERSACIDDHLASCPLCRIELDGLQDIRAGLRSLKTPPISTFRLNKIRELVAAEVSPSYGYPAFNLIGASENWTRRWLFPTVTGTAASVVFGLLLLAVIIIPSDVPSISISTEDRLEADNSLFLASNSVGDRIISPQQFARSRSDISQESPSLNPSGTLVQVAQTDSQDDDEAVFVADVYENGSARITDVVEPSRDRKMMNKLMAAFRRDKTAPPFVPARLDNREELVRVILKFQNVNVNIEDDGSFR